MSAPKRQERERLAIKVLAKSAAWLAELQEDVTKAGFDVEAYFTPGGGGSLWDGPRGFAVRVCRCGAGTGALEIICSRSELGNRMQISKRVMKTMKIQYFSEWFLVFVKSLRFLLFL